MISVDYTRQFINLTFNSGAIIANNDKIQSNVYTK